MSTAETARATVKGLRGRHAGLTISFRRMAYARAPPVYHFYTPGGHRPDCWQAYGGTTKSSQAPGSPVLPASAALARLNISRAVT